MKRQQLARVLVVGSLLSLSFFVFLFKLHSRNSKTKLLERKGRGKIRSRWTQRRRINGVHRGWKERMVAIPRLRWDTWNTMHYLMSSQIPSSKTHALSLACYCQCIWWPLFSYCPLYRVFPNHPSGKLGNCIASQWTSTTMDLFTFICDGKRDY